MAAPNSPGCCLPLLPLHLGSNRDENDTFFRFTAVRLPPSALFPVQMAQGGMQDDAARLETLGSSSNAANDPLEDQGDQSTAVTGLTVSVRFTDGSTTDLEDLYIGSQESVLDVKGRVSWDGSADGKTRCCRAEAAFLVSWVLPLCQIRVLRPGLSSHRLRLIYLGRVMSDSTRPSQWITNLVRRQQQRENPSSVASSIRRSIAGIDISALEGVVRGAVFSSDGSHAAARREESGSPGSASPARRDTKGKGRGTDAAGQDNNAGSARKIWLHCSVGEAGSVEKEEPVQDSEGLPTVSRSACHEPASQQMPDRADSKAAWLFQLPSLPEAPSTSNSQPLRGFDRLREAGFSPDDIANLRVQFHEDGPGDTAVLDDEDPAAQALEDRWMEGLGSRGEDAGSRKSVRAGALLDAGFPRAVPDGMLPLSQRQRTSTRHYFDSLSPAFFSPSCLFSSFEPRATSSVGRHRWPSLPASASTSFTEP